MAAPERCQQMSTPVPLDRKCTLLCAYLVGRKQFNYKYKCADTDVKGKGGDADMTPSSKQRNEA